MENDECEPSVWDLTDPADLLRRMGSRLRFRPGEIRAATVVDASTTCRLLGQQRVVTDSAPWSTYGDWAALDRLGDRLGAAVERLPITGNEPGKPPWTTLVILLTEHGWVSSPPSLAGAEPRLPPPRPGRVRTPRSSVASTAP